MMGVYQWPLEQQRERQELQGGHWRLAGQGFESCQRGEGAQRSLSQTLQVFHCQVGDVRCVPSRLVPRDFFIPIPLVIVQYGDEFTL